VTAKPAVVIAIALVALIPASGSTARGSSPFPSGWIVVPLSERGSTDLFRIRTDGSGLQQTTHTQRDESDPSFAPNGKRVAFTRAGFGIFSLAIDGRGLRRLTTDAQDMDPVYSPNGKSIAFVRGDRLHVMRSNGRGERALRLAPMIPGRPSWSPDGTKIVLSAGDDQAEAFLYTLDARTGRILRRTLLIDGDLTVPGRDDRALLAPNGRTVVFESYRPPPPNCQGSQCEVFALNRRPLAGGVASTRVVCNDCSGAAWSSDSRVLLIVRQNGRLELRVVRDGRTKVVDLRGKALGGLPTLQPR
jgi:Tol biopolymer transport system component